MPDEVQIVITRADLPKADPLAGLDEKDFDLSKAEISIDGVLIKPEQQELGLLKVKAPLGGDGLGTMAVTSPAKKPLGSFDYDRKIGKILRHKIAITRDDLPEADLAFGLTDKDFDLTKAKVWVDGAAVEPERNPDFLRAPPPGGEGMGTIVVTTAAGKFLGVLDYDRRFHEIIKQKNGAGPEPTLRSIVNGAVDTLVHAINGLKPKSKQLDKIIETTADKIAKAIKEAKASKAIKQAKANNEAGTQ
jgi:hypothetical protein